MNHNGSEADMEEVAYFSYIPQNTRKLNEQRLDSLDSSDSWFLILMEWQ